MNYFNDLSTYLKTHVGEKVFKVAIDPGFGCPNWKRGGCSFCEPRSYAPLIDNCEIDVVDQLQNGIAYMKQRHKAKQFIVHFQAGSATNANIETLKNQWETVIGVSGVVGIAISTRPDCLSDECIALMGEIKRKVKIFWLELGLQSANEKTLNQINRGHGVAEFSDAVVRAQKVGLDICAHAIIGLPGEGIDEILNTVKLINELKMWGIKLHNLHVVRGTKLEEEYINKNVIMLSLGEYARLAVDFIEHLSPKVIIHRYNAHAPRRLTVAPKWSINKLGILNAVTDEFKRRDTKQGAKYSISHNI